MVPKEVTIETSLVRDPTFNSVIRVKPWDGAVEVGPDWFAEFKPGEPGANQTLSPLKDGGIVLEWQAAPKRVRLWQHLINDLMSRGGPWDYEVALTFTSRVPSARDVITWLAILEESQEGGVRFHAKFRRSITKRGGKYVFSARVEGVRLTQSKRYKLCVQFGVSPKKLVIHSIEGVAKPSNDTPAVLATAPVPDRARKNQLLLGKSNNNAVLPAEGNVLTRALVRLRAKLNGFKQRPSVAYFDDPYDPFE